ncbi:hypothetical protein ALC56_06576 [Trachymyrmex septentrionalis]|uniref:Uncharacterized protein n=1 Tax=Trachymyrmex septentrionalis TaxID=34720 RepID=A0A195FEP4_9HYME|nr:hypothetical protein ALC56_06576 [Trachymyrmex septentrionalis]
MGKAKASYQERPNNAPGQSVGRSTMAQEVSKSTEVRYTTLQLRAATGQEPRPRGRISSANSTNDRS